MMHRLLAPALACSACMLSPSLSAAIAVEAAAQAPRQPAPAPAAAQTGNPDELLIEKLESTKTSVDYAPEDLVKVVEQLRVQHGLNVQIAWGVLDGAGIRKDKRVEIRLKDVPLSVLLDNLVREIDPSSSTNLGWAVDRGVVVITNRDALQRQSILKAYDVRDLLESGYGIRRFDLTPALSLETTGREWVGGDEKIATKSAGGGTGGGGGGNIFGDEGSEPSRMEKIDSLVELIQDQVESDSWRDNGGQLGSIHVRDGVLFIRQTLKNHAEVRGVLELLRSVRPMGLNVDVAIVRVSAQRAMSIRTQAGDRFPIIDAKVADELAFLGNVDGVLFRTTTGTRNGVAAWISDISQIDTIAGQHAIVAQGTGEKTPIMGAVHSGLEIIALPLIETDGATASVDVQMAWKPKTDIAPATAGDNGPTAIDRTQQRMRTVSSQSRCKLGDAIVLTVPASPSDAGASLANDDWLIVRVRPAS